MTDRELNQIVTDHLPLARKAAQRYAKWFYLEEEDVYEFALECLARKAGQWKPDGGSSFGGYAAKHLGHDLFWYCNRQFKKREQAEIMDRECWWWQREPTAYQSHARRQAWNVIATMLDTREWMILAYHFGLEPLPKLTQKEIGQRLGVSKQCVHKIEQRAIRKVREAYSTPEGRTALQALREYVLVKSA